MGSATESYAVCGVMNDGWAFLEVLERLPFATLASTSPALFTLRIPMFGQMSRCIVKPPVPLSVPSSLLLSFLLANAARNLLS